MFLLENGHSMFLWLGQASPPDLIQSILNLPSLAHLQGHMVSNTQYRYTVGDETVSVIFFLLLTNCVFQAALPELDNPLSKKVRSIISSLLDKRPNSMKVQ